MNYSQNIKLLKYRSERVLNGSSGQVTCIFERKKTLVVNINNDY